MCAQPLDELFAGHAGPWTEQEWAGLPESMGRVELLDPALIVSPFPTVAHQRLARNLAVSARTAEGRLRLNGPFPTVLDLAALAVATRYPGP